MVDLSFPVSGGRVELPGERSAIDRDSTDDPDRNPGKESNYSCTPKCKARRGTIEDCQGNS